MKLTSKDFIRLMDCTGAEIEGLLDLASDMKRADYQGRPLTDKTLGLLFTVPSTRTRISFQVAARQLGGHAEFLNSSDLQMRNQETLMDTAAVMGRYLDAIVIRLYDMNAYGKGREALMTFSKYAGVPIINALDDKDHPCQIMADLLTMKEKYGAEYKKRKLLLTWGYSKRQKSPGVPHSMLTAAALLGMDVRFAYPKGFEMDPEYVEFAKAASITSGAKIEFCHDLEQASEGVDVIYVKNWKSLTMTTEEDAQLREEIRTDWCVSSEHFRRANRGAYYMDCMPFVRGEQVTAEIADGPNSIIYDQAENRLHAQKAILTSLL